ncbi:MAG TPA: hypothetical protein VEA80_02450 [Vitreimonas sp.]|uniref:hypothetical protein n=1 Tax=Vitreimonas sp. TaxID=3069702 RepID=UPI002D2EE1F9|nr:hypothetical protein [Vitreimonas sp.]HYD86311.1 hypothetical protein [Vitreimonas sp.]
MANTQAEAGAPESATKGSQNRAMKAGRAVSEQARGATHATLQSMREHPITWTSAALGAAALAAGGYMYMQRRRNGKANGAVDRGAEDLTH